MYNDYREKWSQFGYLGYINMHFCVGFLSIELAASGLDGLSSSKFDP